MNRHSSKKFGSGVASARSIGPMSREIYTGAELAPSTARPGAHDASRLPSLIHGQRVTREQQRADLHAPLPAACPVTSRLPTRVTVPDGARAAPIELVPPTVAPPEPPPAKVTRVATATPKAAPAKAATPARKTAPSADADFLDLAPTPARQLAAALDTASEAVRLLTLVVTQQNQLTALLSQVLQHLQRAISPSHGQ